MTFTTPPAEHPRAAAIESGTGTSLADWAARLEEAGARDLDHTAIAGLLGDRWEVGDWWAQGVAVAYEQLIGRRVEGQSRDGDFAASASRTVPGDMDAVLAAWDAFLTPRRRDELGLAEPSVTGTAAWRYWRAAVSDGSRLSVNITAKDGAGDSARSVIAIEHKGIATAEGRESWRTAWKAVLSEFTTSLKETR